MLRRDGSVLYVGIDKINTDETEYSLYIKNVTEIDTEKIKFVAKTTNVNSVIAKQMLEKKEVCILKAKAPKIKAVIAKLQELDIDFDVNPSFKY